MLRPAGGPQPRNRAVPFQILRLDASTWVCAAFFVLFGALSVFRHVGLSSWILDLGVKVQLLDNARNGRWFQSSIEVGCYFGDHFNPGFFLLTPVYALLPDPIQLIVLQAALVATGGLAAARLAAREAPGFLHAPICAAALYLVHVSTGNSVLYDVHETTLAAPLVLFAALAWVTGRRATAIALLVGLLTFREEMGLAMAAFGAWLVVRNRADRAAGGWLMAISLAYTAACITLVIPAFRGTFSDTLSHLLPAWTGAGESNVELSWMESLGRKGLYLAVLLLPVWVQPGQRLRLLLPVLVTVAPLLLSSRVSHFSGRWHYDALVMPFVVLAAIEAWRAAGATNVARAAHTPTSTSMPLAWSRRALAVTLLSLGAIQLNSRVVEWTSAAVQNLPRRAAFDELRGRIPATASLATSQNLGPHLVREWLQVYPVVDWPPAQFGPPQPPARFALVDFEFEQRHRLIDVDPQRQRLMKLGYQSVAALDGFELFECTISTPVDQPAGSTEERIRRVEAELRGYWSLR